MVSPFGAGFGVQLSVSDGFSAPLAKFGLSIAKSQAAAAALTTGLKTSALRMGIFAIGIAGVGYAFSKAMQPGIEFERQMREVSAVTGATGKEFTKMTNLAKKLGIETVFSAKEASEAMYMLGSRGIKTSEQMEMLLQPSMDLAAALKFDLPQATELTLSSLKMFNMETGRAREVVDLLTNAYRNSAANAEKLAVSIQYAGPAFSNVGMSIKQMLPPLEALYDLGIEASMAGTALRKAINSLLEPTAAVTEGLANLGLSVDDVNPRMHSFEDIIRTLGETANFEDESIKIFGERAGPIMEMLVKQGADALAEYEEQLGVTGSAAETAAEQLKGLPGALVLIKSSIESVWIALEELFAPALEESVKWVTEGINSFLLWLQSSEKMKVGIQDFIKAYASMVRDWLKPSIGYIKDVVVNVMTAVGTWNDLSERQKEFVISGAKVGLVLTGLVAAIAILGPTVIGLGKALLILNTPMLSVLGIVALLGAGVALLWVAWNENWGKIQDKVDAVWTAIKERDWKALANIIVMPTLDWVGKKFDTLADWARGKLGLPEDTNIVADWKDLEVLAELAAKVTWGGMKAAGKAIDKLAFWIQGQMGIPEEARKGAWELTAITTTIPFAANLLWGGIKSAGKVITDIVEFIRGNAKLDKPIDELIVSVADFLIELPDPAKWMFKIGTRVWEYAALGYGIWWAAKSLLSAVKIAPIALPALLPILIGIGLALVGLDVLGNKLKEKLEEEDIEGLLEEFSKTHPLGMKLAVAIKEITGLEADLVLAYIDAEWPSIADKVGLTLFQIQIPLKIMFDIDLRTVFDEFWEDTKQVFKEAWEDLTWEWLSWKNFVTALKEAWDNTDWGWFGNSIKWLMGLFKKDIEKEAITIETASELFGTDMLYLAAIRMTERGGEGVEMGIKVYSQKFKDELKKMYPDIAEGTKEWQILAAAKSTEFYWKEFKEKFGYSAKLVLKDVSQDIRNDFTEYMGSKFCPTDTGDKAVDSLNRNWVPNMKKWYLWLSIAMENWGEGGMEEFIKGIEKKAKSGSALSDMEKATLKFLKPFIYKSPGFYPLGAWGGNAAEEFSDGVVKGLKKEEKEAEKQSKSFFDVILGSLEGMMKKLVEVLKKVPGIGPFIEEIEGIIAVFKEAEEEAEVLKEQFEEMLNPKEPSPTISEKVNRWANEIRETITWLVGIQKGKEAEMLADWTAYLSSQRGITLTTYEDFAEYMSGFTEEQKEQLDEQFEDWTTAYNNVSADAKKFYSLMKGYSGDFTDFSATELETMVTDWDNAGKDIKSGWAAFTIWLEKQTIDWTDVFTDFATSLKTGWSDIISDWIEGTKPWETFWTEMWEEFRKTAIEMLADIVTNYLWKELLTQIIEVAKKLKEAGGSGVGAFGLVLEAVAGVWGGLVSLGAKVVEFIAGLFGIKSKPVDDVKDAVDAAGKKLDETTGKVNAAGEAIEGIDDTEIDEVTAATQAAKDKFNELMSSAQSTVSSISYGFALLARNISGNISGAVSSTISKLATIPDTISITLKYFEQNYWTIKNHYDSIKDKTVTVTTNYVSTGTTAPASYQLGTPYVPETGLAFLHKGERVTPAGQNRPAGIATYGGNPVLNVKIMHIGDIRTSADKDEFYREVTGKIEEVLKGRL